VKQNVNVDNTAISDIFGVYYILCLVQGCSISRTTKTTAPYQYEIQHMLSKICLKDTDQINDHGSTVQKMSERYKMQVQYTPLCISSFPQFPADTS
jgi:glutamine synthetase